MTNFIENTTDLRALSDEVEQLLQAAQDVGRRSGVAIFNAGQAEAVQRQLIANEYKERGEKLPTLPALEAIIKTATANEQYEADTLKKDFELIKLAINARLAQMSAAQTLVSCEKRGEEFARNKYEGATR